MSESGRVSSGDRRGDRFGRIPRGGAISQSQRFYTSLTCEDLPLKGDTNVAACEQAIGEFGLPERGCLRDSDLAKEKTVQRMNGGG